MLKVSTKSEEFTDIEPGVYHGTCIWVLDLGKQPGFNQGEFTRQIFINWEIEVQGKRETIGSFYTLSFGAKANLGKMLRGWLGKLPDELDLHALIGRPCMVHVVMNDNERPKILSVMPGQGIEASKETYTEADALALPDFFQKKIEEGIANAARAGAPYHPPAKPVLDDEIPFGGGQ